MTDATKRVFILLGMPGVGKGTQAEFLAKQYRLFHIDTGACIRHEIASGSELGQNAKSFVDQGKLIPFDLVMQVIKSSMLRIEDTQQGYLFDGFPRNREQAEGLNGILSELGLDLSAVLYLEAPHEILMDRLAYRVTCAKCSAKYNLKLNPPKQEGQCDACGSTELITRADDRPEVIENRLKAYHDETAPLIDYYDSRGTLKRLNGDQAIETVTGEIRQLVSPFFNTSDKMMV